MPLNKQVKFQRKRLTQTRHRRMWTMSHLAELVGITPQAISSFERGDSVPKPETLRELARQLDVPEFLFTTPLRENEEQLRSIISFRSLAASSSKARNQAKVYLQWSSSLLALASNHVEIPPVNIPDFGIEDFSNLTDDDIEVLAERTRRHFGLGDGPISDLTLLLENNGVSISYVPLTAGIDGLCAYFSDRPYVLVNRKFKAVRRRFDLSHELGHLIMHRFVSDEDVQQKELFKKIEADAHRFAGAFLLPEKSFAQEVYGIDIESLKNLKERWKVSIQGIIMRLHNINMISDHQKARLFQRVSVLGMRKNEVLDDVIPVENSRLFQRIFEFLEKSNVLPITNIVDESKFPTEFIRWATNFTEDELSPRQSNNVVNFIRKGEL